MVDNDIIILSHVTKITDEQSQPPLKLSDQLQYLLDPGDNASNAADVLRLARAKPSNDKEHIASQSCWWLLLPAETDHAHPDNGPPFIWGCPADEKAVF